MDITALISQIYSAVMLKNTVFANQDKKQKHLVLFQNTKKKYFFIYSYLKNPKFFMI